MSYTSTFVLAIVLVLGVYDIFADTWLGITGTESWFIRSVAGRHPTFVFGSGYLCGHLFAAMRPEVVKEQVSK